MRIKTTLTCSIAILTMLIASASNAAIIRDTEIEDALLRVIRPMAADAGLNPDLMQIRVIINPQYNAFVAQDNMIYMNSGLITSSANMLEIAGVLAHEIGHISAGHIPRRGEVVQNASVASLLSAVAAIALSASGAGGAAFGVLAGGLDRSKRVLLARSRQDEGVADETAISLMSAQNFSLKPMAEAMRKIGAERILPETRQSDYYLTHPATKDRSAVFQDFVNRFEDDTFIEPQWMTNLHRRINTKLLGWTTPPRNILSNTLGEDDQGAIYKRAIAFFRLSDVIAAEGELRLLLEKSPNDAYYHEFLGDVLMAKGDAAAAVLSYQTAIGLMDNDLNKGQIYLSIGRALMIIGDDASLARAITILKKATADEPEWAFAKNQLGIAYGKAGHFADADLILAEEALLQGNARLATRLAKRVTSHTNATAIHKRLAADILLQSNP